MLAQQIDPEKIIDSIVVLSDRLIVAEQKQTELEISNLGLQQELADAKRKMRDMYQQNKSLEKQNSLLVQRVSMQKHPYVPLVKKIDRGIEPELQKYHVANNVVTWYTFKAEELMSGR